MRSVEAFEQRITIDRRRRYGSATRPAVSWTGVSRILLGVGVAVAMCFLGVWLGVGGESSHRSLLAGSPDQLDYDQRGYVEVTVASGDTLWSLARRYGPETRDIRETIDRIRMINGLHDRASLRPGERLTIPTH